MAYKGSLADLTMDELEEYLEVKGNECCENFGRNRINGILPSFDSQRTILGSLCHWSRKNERQGATEAEPTGKLFYSYALFTIMFSWEVSDINQSAPYNLRTGQAGSENVQYFTACEKAVLCESRPLQYAIIDLIASYHVFDISYSYPRLGSPLTTTPSEHLTSPCNPCSPTAPQMKAHDSGEHLSQLSSPRYSITMVKIFSQYTCVSEALGWEDLYNGHHTHQPQVFSQGSSTSSVRFSISRRYRVPATQQSRCDSVARYQACDNHVNTIQSNWHNHCEDGNI